MSQTCVAAFDPVGFAWCPEIGIERFGSLPCWQILQALAGHHANEVLMLVERCPREPSAAPEP